MKNQVTYKQTVDYNDYSTKRRAAKRYGCAGTGAMLRYGRSRVVYSNILDFVFVFLLYIRMYIDR